MAVTRLHFMYVNRVEQVTWKNVNAPILALNVRLLNILDLELLVSI